MSHPDPNGPAATQPWRVGDELWNPATLERAVILMRRSVAHARR